MTSLFQQIEKALAEIQHGWCSNYKASAMAATIVALRPKISIEIGVYAGKGLITMGLAHKFLGHGMAIGIDPFSAADSAEGQIKPEDKKWWSELNHEQVFMMAKENIFKHAVQNTARIERMRSDKFEPPDGIGFCRVDGNHGEQCIEDVRRYAPFITRGGILMMDDRNWEGGSVEKATKMLSKMGFKSLYEFDEKENGGLTEVFIKL